MRFFVLLVLLIAACNSNPKKESDPELSSDIQKFRLTNLTDSSIDLTKYKGKVVFINFWATWCKPCIEEMPAIKKAIDSLKKEKIEFLFASEDSHEEIERFEAAHNFGFDYVKVVNLEELNIMGLPTTFIFDKSGKQVYSEMGYRKWDDKSNLDLLSKIINQQ